MSGATGMCQSVEAVLDRQGIRFGNPDDDKLGKLQREDPHLRDMIKALEDQESEKAEELDADKLNKIQGYCLNSKGVLCKHT